MSFSDDSENLLDDGTSDGLVPIAVPSPSDALIRSWAWSRHLLSIGVVGVVVAVAAALVN